jgi:hypothetical protein
MSNKASDIIKNLTPLMGEAGARDAAMAAVEKNLAENDLGPAPALTDDVITEVLKSLAAASAGVQAPEGQVQVQVAKSAAAAAGSTDDIDVAVASIQGDVKGLNAKVDSVVVYLNKSFAAVAQTLELLLRGVKASDAHVLAQGAELVELQKSLQAKQPPRSVAPGARAAAAPNLQDDAANAQLTQGQEEINARFALQEQINVEIAKSAGLEQTAPGSQKGRLAQLRQASLMLTRPIPAKEIAATCNIQLPA